MILKTTLFACLFLFAFHANAQVGINETNPQSSLDIVASNVASPANNDGVLIPRISAFPATNPTADQQSMLVYLTSNITGLNISGIAQDYPIGFYFWDDDIPNWVALGGGSKESWFTEGNTGTNSSIHFLGTTDPQALSLRTNNIERFRVANQDQVHAMARGTQLRPFYSWEEDQESGMWLIQRNELGFGAGNLEFMRFRERNSQDELVLNLPGADIDFRLESDQFDDLIFADALTSQVSIGNKVPIFPIDTFQSYAYFRGDHAVNGYSDSGVGVYGSDVDDGTGVEGVSIGGGVGVAGASNATGIVSYFPGAGGTFTGTEAGILSISEDVNTVGVLSAANNGALYSLVGRSQGIAGNGPGIGGTGVVGFGNGNNSMGVFGGNITGTAMAAIFANGDLTATGVKPFTIDHPLDPENKILKHFSIESDEVLNVYRGTTVFDINGEATIELPEYFASINVNYSYQLTAVGAAMPNIYVAEEVSNNSFKVAGGMTGKKVSWTVFANRNDAYVKANPNRIKSEQNKTGNLIGKYLDHKSWNQTNSKAYFELKEIEVSKSKPKGSIKKSDVSTPYNNGPDNDDDDADLD
jgi:hypothetical protein